MSSTTTCLRVATLSLVLVFGTLCVPNGQRGPSDTDDLPFLAGYTAFPSEDPNDGKFLGVSGKGLTLAGIPIVAYIGIEEGKGSFQVGVFDGDIGGLWDIGGESPLYRIKFELFADPLRNGTEDMLIGFWYSDDCIDDDWSSKSYPTNATARAPSGNYFYRLRIGWDGVIPSGVLDNFKIRATGQVSIERDQEFGFNGAPQGDFDPCVGLPGLNTYDGDWKFYFYVPQALEHIEFWDGDADRVDDSNDPNTYGAGEGYNPGAPADGPSPYGQCFNVDPSIYYIITDPDGNEYENSNPSGNMERERFTVGNHADEDHFVNYPLSPGQWEFHMIGMDAHNMNFLRATEIVFSTPDPPLPVNPAPEVKPDYDEKVPGGATYYYAHTVTNKGIEQAFDLRAVSSQWSTRIFEDSNANGLYDFGEPETDQTPSLATNETYHVLVALEVPQGPPGASDIIQLTASSTIEWAVQDSAYDRIQIQQNQPPIPDAGGPYIADEGDIMTFDASGSYDPDGDPLEYMWDVDDDGVFETSYSSSPFYDFIFGDDFDGKARVRVTDGTHEVEDVANVTINNVAPSIDSFLDPWALIDVTFRIAGEKYHDVEFFLYEDRTEIGYAYIVRYPGSPNDQAVTLYDVNISLLNRYSVLALYTPMDDPINGEIWGSDPAWVILDFHEGNETRVHHTFNVRHQETWTWRIDNLNQYFAGHNFTFQASASDPGSDDLTFTWDWGDGSSESRTYYNDGMGPDPYPSYDVNPMAIVNTTVHAFSAPGNYVVTLEVADDDGGQALYTYTISA